MPLHQNPNEIRIPPFWKVMTQGQPGSTDGSRAIILSPGEGWGTGAHETTQLCLQAISVLYPWRNGPFTMLDFGSGSGILSIAAAHLGASVDAVEIDPAAIENARINAELNQVGGSIRYAQQMESPPRTYDLVVANILRPILLEYAAELAKRLRPQGMLILSGLVATDVPEISVRYSELLDRRQPEIFQRGQWRALVWR